MDDIKQRHRHCPWAMSRLEKVISCCSLIDTNDVDRSSVSSHSIEKMQSVIRRYDKSTQKSTFREFEIIRFQFSVLALFGARFDVAKS